MDGHNEDGSVAMCHTDRMLSETSKKLCMSDLSISEG